MGIYFWKTGKNDTSVFHHSIDFLWNKWVKNLGFDLLVALIKPWTVVASYGTTSEFVM
jgi:hypothetical protein